MSNAALNAVFTRSKSRGTARLVLLAIADRADEAGKAWCGASDIAARSNIQRQNVCRLVRELVDLGELEVAPRSGPNFTNNYTISGALMTRQSQGETVSPRSEGSLTMIRGESHGETQTPINPIEPKSAKRNRFDAGAVSLPFSSPEFSEAWKNWIQHRKEKRQTLTPTATRQQLAKLGDMGEVRAIAAINHSVASGYTGIFEPKAHVEKPRYSPDGRPLNAAAQRAASAKRKGNPL